jgi:hypothetical protein
LAWVGARFGPAAAFVGAGAFTLPALTAAFAWPLRAAALPVTPAAAWRMRAAFAAAISPGDFVVREDAFFGAVAAVAARFAAPGCFPVASRVRGADGVRFAGLAMVSILLSVPASVDAACLLDRRPWRQALCQTRTGTL